ncbi:hypothetical protein ASPZODRAFT_141461 [Penicilliopsis zonata CBS 506.65]|uniref:SET domain-containing protein n=1 Tax=Penicilliopsis zonata CBS 506.65 TaxID=1073090 RepID=A0A1L9SLA6_9EURO|nr:hypothetical protein ASPZODRAFT_141461 [Penicilliopsis zonata CBS 506.65]OJJ47901.1 hypothetical protein ASPZODRAFT_141461 [Penicilliopsis zonata CBS 506.65]
MSGELHQRLWRRECGDASRRAGISSLYGSSDWIKELDIVNELGGHTGCVNALSWSRSGQFLASGSDDLHLNIYSYQPDSSTAPFALNTTVFTGHKANIFSVKFMPHSNDRTVVTCAGDSQVRVFDIEYAARNGDMAATSAFRASARSRRFNNFFTGARYLSEGNTNARVYRSHADRVKRIVTESSPYLFLTCSEDGEVRQWDLRQPSSSYPAPRGGQGFMAYRPGLEHDDTNVPPPLISYKRYHLDLNTISCSPSQPHYIALGGAHLHCFLHDRRMLGRNTLTEQGRPGGGGGLATSTSLHEDELMGHATRCVRRFAPGGKKRMHSQSDGHITACKISDANPNEMVVSWSGEHIYSFDLIRSPDAREMPEGSSAPESSSARKKGKASGASRKRKRQKGASSSSLSNSSGNQPPRRHLPEQNQEQQDNDDDDDDDDADESENLSFRVRYANGEAEEIPIPPRPEGEAIERARNSLLNEAQRVSLRIAKSLVRLRKSLFSLETTLREAVEDRNEDLTSFTSSFSASLTHASACLPQMAETMSTWTYPVNPSEDVVAFQKSLRHNRQAAWRFVQAAGTVSRVLGGRLDPAALGSDEAGNLEHGSLLDPEDGFHEITLAPAEPDTIDRASQFGYDFLRAILLWVEGGRSALLEGFKHKASQRRLHRNRFPVPESADDSAIEERLIPYLRDLAGLSPVVNVDASRFETDQTRVLFPTQAVAVTAFGNAVRLPLEDLQGTAARTESTGREDTEMGAGLPRVRALDRNATKRFWGLKVARGVLMEVGTGVNFEFVNRAFGGLQTTLLGTTEGDDGDDEEPESPERMQEDIDPEEEDEEPIQGISLMFSSRTGHHEAQDSDGGEESSMRLGEDSSESDDEDEDEMNDTSDEDEGEDEDDDDDDDDDEEAEERFIRRYGLRRTRREDVALDVPCSSHTRVFRGHCNIKTVKDVNFFGLDDEYVVSGSDSGHVFIWERKTGKLVNILEGDGEVVNVVQGHPYEPTMAVSGIDSTIKIFSSDRRAQNDAREGLNILDPDNAANSLQGDARRVGGLRSCKRLDDSYRIMSQNDVDRQGGMSEAFITRSMLARLAATLRERQTTAGGVTGITGGITGGNTVIQDENCSVMMEDRTSITTALYADPHNPHLHLARGRVHERLGFPDLAAADAYRALSLLESVVDPDGYEYHARKAVASEGNGDDDEDEDEDGGFEAVSEGEYDAVIGEVYSLLVRSLVRCGCFRDAYEFCVRGMSLSRVDLTEDEGLREQMRLIKRKYLERQGGNDPDAVENLDAVDVDPAALNAQGYARRVLYPWNEHEPDRKAAETLSLLNDRLKEVAPKCEVRAVALPALHGTMSGKGEDNEEGEGEVSVQLGLFAKEDISPGEIILRESSLLTATNRLHDDLCDACNAPLPELSSETPPVACEDCDDTIFCSQDCHDRAAQVYHSAVCGFDGLDSIGKDIPDPKDKADYLYLLLLGRAIAMAATQDVHPLDLPEVKYIWGDFHSLDDDISPSASNPLALPFSFQLNILQPTRILEEMELDPFATLPRYDTWVLNTLYAKFRGTASGRLSTWDGGPEVCAVHPLWCLANHSCDPNVRWEWGGEITFMARRRSERAVWAGKAEDDRRGEDLEGIRKDAEILNHYCDIGLAVTDRREWACGALGGFCQCERCVWEAALKE